jgi:hypothetical protein
MGKWADNCPGEDLWCEKISVVGFLRLGLFGMSYLSFPIIYGRRRLRSDEIDRSIASLIERAMVIQ